MNTSELRVPDYSSFALNASFHAFEIQAQAKAVWALLEQIQGNNPGTEIDLTSVSYLLSAIERSSEQLAVNIGDTEYAYCKKQQTDAPA